MKKIYLLIATVCTLALSSCAGFLDQDNRSDVSSESFYATATGFESLTNAMYSTIRTLYNNQPVLFVGGSDLYGDGKSESVVYTYFTFTPDDSGVLKFYQNCFKGIQMCNSVIHYGETTEDNAKRLQYIDEARFVRAWYYFQLVQQFGGVEINKEMFNSAVMSHPRNTLGECYEFIISELTDLVGANSHLLATSNVGRANKQAANFFLAKAYLTRGWLNGQGYEVQEENIAQATDFADAEKYAKAAINGVTPSKSIEEVFDIANENDPEFFWSCCFDYKAVENPSSDGSYQMCQFGAYLGGSERANNKAMDGNFSPLLHMHQQFDKGDGRYEQTFMFEFYEDDKTANGLNYFAYYNAPTTKKIRYYYTPWWATEDDVNAWLADDPNGIKDEVEYISYTIADGGIAPSNGQPETFKNRRHMDVGVPCIKKFDDYTATSMANRSSTCSMHDVSLARLGEAYLIAAEAAMKQGHNGDAADYINTLRKRPGTVKAGFEAAMTVSANDINVDFILKERCCELAGEYVRWTDIKRMQVLVDYVSKYQEDEIDLNNLKGTDGKYKILRPIPQNAIDLNQAEITQNPGF